MAHIGRPRINYDIVSARFPADTLGHIKTLLNDGETQADFIRAAVTSAIAAREIQLRRVFRKTETEHAEASSP